MLQKLNERIQGVIAWVVIVLIAFTFALFGIEYYMQSHEDASLQLEVNGQPITKKFFELNYWRARQRTQAALKAGQEKQLKKAVLDDIVLNSVSVQAAKMNGFEVSNEQAESAILNIPQFQKEGQFSSDQYQQALSNALFTPETFQQEVRQGMLLNQQRFVFIGTAVALPNEIKHFVKLYLQSRNYNYLIIPATAFTNSSGITDKDISTYYQQHQNEFVSPEQVAIDYISLSPQDLKKNLKPSEEEVTRYYEENYASSPSKPALSEVRTTIENQLIADMAQSQYTKTLEQLTDLSYQTPDSLTSVAETLKLPIQQTPLFSRQGGDTPLTKNPQLLKAAFSHDVLALGNNSEPIRIDNDTVMVLRVNKHLPASHQSLSEVKQQISHLITKEVAQTQAKQVGETLISNSSPAQEADILKKYHLQWQTTEDTPRDTNKVAEPINTLAFSIARIGNKSGKSLDNGDYILVHLKKINDGNLAALDNEQVASITQQLEAGYGEIDYQLYINSLLKEAKITKY